MKRFLKNFKGDSLSLGKALLMIASVVFAVIALQCWLLTLAASLIQYPITMKMALGYIIIFNIIATLFKRTSK